MTEVVWSQSQLSYHPDPHLGPWVGHSSIYPIYDLLEFVKPVILWIDKISMTQGNCRMSERSLGEGPVRMVARGLEPDQ